MFFLFIDLKLFLPYSHSNTIGGVAHVHRENRIFAAYGLSADV